MLISKHLGKTTRASGFGHESGTKSVKIIIKTCAKLAIENLTLMPFQQRTGTDLRGRHFNENTDTIIKEFPPTGKQHQIKHDGNLEKLPQSAQKST
jgi:undecaprenyl diphosphate synthase